MKTKIYSIVISLSVLAFALIAEIPDVFAQENDKGMTSEHGDKG